MCSLRTPKRDCISSFSLGLASSAAVIPGQPLLCPRGEGVRSLRLRPLVATALTIQPTSIACYWIQATHTPSDRYCLSIHWYPILCCGVHVPVVTIYVTVKAACFIGVPRGISSWSGTLAEVTQLHPRGWCGSKDATECNPTSRCRELGRKDCRNRRHLCFGCLAKQQCLGVPRKIPYGSRFLARVGQNSVSVTVNGTLPSCPEK